MSQPRPCAVHIHFSMCETCGENLLQKGDLGGGQCSPGPCLGTQGCNDAHHLPPPPTILGFSHPHAGGTQHDPGPPPQGPEHLVTMLFPGTDAAPAHLQTRSVMRATKSAQSNHQASAQRNPCSSAAACPLQPRAVPLSQLPFSRQHPFCHLVPGYKQPKTPILPPEPQTRDSVFPGTGRSFAGQDVSPCRARGGREGITKSPVAHWEEDGK